MKDVRNVVLDTNVLVAGFLSKKGDSSQIIEMVLSGMITIHYHVEILEEYNFVLSLNNFKGRISPDDVKKFLNYITKFAKNVIVSKSNISLPDESDRIFYDVAKEAGAILVTSNIKHYPFEDSIMEPSSYIGAYRNQLWKSIKPPTIVEIKH